MAYGAKQAEEQLCTGVCCSATDAPPNPFLGPELSTGFPSSTEAPFQPASAKMVFPDPQLAYTAVTQGQPRLQRRPSVPLTGLAEGVSLIRAVSESQHDESGLRFVKDSPAACLLRDATPFLRNFRPVGFPSSFQAAGMASPWFRSPSQRALPSQHTQSPSCDSLVPDALQRSPSCHSFSPLLTASEDARGASSISRRGRSNSVMAKNEPGSSVPQTPLHGFSASDPFTVIRDVRSAPTGINPLGAPNACTSPMTVDGSSGTPAGSSGRIPMATEGYEGAPKLAMGGVGMVPPLRSYTHAQFTASEMCSAAPISPLLHSATSSTSLCPSSNNMASPVLRFSSAGCLGPRPSDGHTSQLSSQPSSPRAFSGSGAHAPVFGLSRSCTAAVAAPAAGSPLAATFFSVCSPSRLRSNMLNGVSACENPVPARSEATETRSASMVDAVPCVDSGSSISSLPPRGCAAASEAVSISQRAQCLLGNDQGAEAYECSAPPASSPSVLIPASLPESVTSSSSSHEEPTQRDSHAPDASKPPLDLRSRAEAEGNGDEGISLEETARASSVRWSDAGPSEALVCGGSSGAASGATRPAQKKRREKPLSLTRYRCGLSASLCGVGEQKQNLPTRPAGDKTSAGVSRITFRGSLSPSPRTACTPARCYPSRGRTDSRRKPAATGRKPMSPPPVTKLRSTSRPGSLRLRRAASVGGLHSVSSSGADRCFPFGGVRLPMDIRTLKELHQRLPLPYTVSLSSSATVNSCRKKAVHMYPERAVRSVVKTHHTLKKNQTNGALTNKVPTSPSGGPPASGGVCAAGSDAPLPPVPVDHLRAPSTSQASKCSEIAVTSSRDGRAAFRPSAAAASRSSSNPTPVEPDAAPPRRRAGAGSSGQLGGVGAPGGCRPLLHQRASGTLSHQAQDARPSGLFPHPRLFRKSPAFSTVVGGRVRAIRAGCTAPSAHQAVSRRLSSVQPPSKSADAHRNSAVGALSALQDSRNVASSGSKPREAGRPLVANRGSGVGIRAKSPGTVTSVRRTESTLPPRQQRMTRPIVRGSSPPGTGRRPLLPASCAKSGSRSEDLYVLRRANGAQSSTGGFSGEPNEQSVRLLRVLSRPPSSVSSSSSSCDSVGSSPRRAPSVSSLCSAAKADSALHFALQGTQAFMSVGVCASAAPEGQRDPIHSGSHSGSVSCSSSVGSLTHRRDSGRRADGHQGRMSGQPRGQQDQGLAGREGGRDPRADGGSCASASLAGASPAGRSSVHSERQQSLPESLEPLEMPPSVVKSPEPKAGGPDTRTVHLPRLALHRLTKAAEETEGTAQAAGSSAPGERDTPASSGTSHAASSGGCPSKLAGGRTAGPQSQKANAGPLSRARRPPSVDSGSVDRAAKPRNPPLQSSPRSADTAVPRGGRRHTLSVGGSEVSASAKQRVPSTIARRSSERRAVSVKPSRPVRTTSSGLQRRSSQTPVSRFATSENRAERKPSLRGFGSTAAAVNSPAHRLASLEPESQRLAPVKRGSNAGVASGKKRAEEQLPRPAVSQEFAEGRRRAAAGEPLPSLKPAKSTPLQHNSAALALTPRGSQKGDSMVTTPAPVRGNRARAMSVRPTAELLRRARQASGGASSAQQVSLAALRSRGSTDSVSSRKKRSVSSISLRLSRVAGGSLSPGSATSAQSSLLPDIQEVAQALEVPSMHLVMNPIQPAQERCASGGQSSTRGSLGSSARRTSLTPREDRGISRPALARKSVGNESARGRAEGQTRDSPTSRGMAVVSRLRRSLLARESSGPTKQARLPRRDSVRRRVVSPPSRTSASVNRTPSASLSGSRGGAASAVGDPSSSPKRGRTLSAFVNRVPQIQGALERNSIAAVPKAIGLSSPRGSAPRSPTAGRLAQGLQRMETPGRQGATLSPPRLGVRKPESDAPVPRTDKTKPRIDVSVASRRRVNVAAPSAFMRGDVAGEAGDGSSAASSPRVARRHGPTLAARAPGGLRTTGSLTAASPLKERAGIAAARARGKTGAKAAARGRRRIVAVAGLAQQSREAGAPSDAEAQAKAKEEKEESKPKYSVKDLPMPAQRIQSIVNIPEGVFLPIKDAPELEESALVRIFENDMCKPVARGVFEKALYGLTSELSMVIPVDLKNLKRWLEQSLEEVEKERRELIDIRAFLEVLPNFCMVDLPQDFVLACRDGQFWKTWGKGWMGEDGRPLQIPQDRLLLAFFCAEGLEGGPKWECSMMRREDERMQGLIREEAERQRRHEEYLRWMRKERTLQEMVHWKQKRWRQLREMWERLIVAIEIHRQPQHASLAGVDNHLTVSQEIAYGLHPERARSVLATLLCAPTPPGDGLCLPCSPCAGGPVADHGGAARCSASDAPTRHMASLPRSVEAVFEHPLSPTQPHLPVSVASVEVVSSRAELAARARVSESYAMAIAAMQRMPLLPSPDYVRYLLEHKKFGELNSLFKTLVGYTIPQLWILYDQEEARAEAAARAQEAARAAREERFKAIAETQAQRRQAEKSRFEREETEREAMHAEDLLSKQEEESRLAKKRQFLKEIPLSPAEAKDVQLLLSRAAKKKTRIYSTKDSKLARRAGSAEFAQPPPVKEFSPVLPSVESRTSSVSNSSSVRN
ncbi:hypothetical protein BESB_077110 [Besnoitia besnoiti]|uniref:Uncharacterized protein n=1 Tax=Besnoitia besnoiti TaxID=94643 RepID=A0A2A9M8J9_BESBE|nr:hypothetical protein BESB_077110 [Besnoitia besnoiti]PFH33494.1 hypothetical protein BESB_077110 [Besnoitia besnoiti]